MARAIIQPVYSQHVLFSSVPVFLQPICVREGSSKAIERGREWECVQRGRGQALALCMCVSVCECAPRDLTLLFKPCGYHGAGRLIWPLESKSKASGPCRAAHTGTGTCTHTYTHAHAHTRRIWRISPQRCMTQRPKKKLPTLEYSEATQQID